MIDHVSDLRQTISGWIGERYRGGVERTIMDHRDDLIGLCPPGHAP
ncbi:MAG TPA: hypothetical protein VIY28_00435 [Pseudonocardiaceae bacterium]